MGKLEIFYVFMHFPLLIQVNQRLKDLLQEGRERIEFKEFLVIDNSILFVLLISFQMSIGEIQMAGYNVKNPRVTESISDTDVFDKADRDKGNRLNSRVSKDIFEI